MCGVSYECSVEMEGPSVRGLWECFVTLLGLSLQKTPALIVFAGAD